MQYDENAEKYGYEGEMMSLKCDKLTAYKGDVTIPVYGTIADAEVYLKKDVDAAIAELKDKVKLCSDFELAARKDIEEMRGQHQMLKQFGHYKLSPVPGKMINHEVRQYVSYNVVCMVIKHLESENAELKQKLEDVQASMYCDVVDANMDNRRLKRALWLMTAEWAEGMGLASCNIAIKLSVKERFYYHDEANREKDIKKYRHRQVVFYKYADYCRKKAEASK